MVKKVADQSPSEEHYEGPWRLTKVVRRWLKEMEWEETPQLDQATGISRTGFSYSPDEGDNPSTCYLEAWESQEVCKLFMYRFETRVPEDRLQECLVFANEMNNNRSVGFASVDRFDEGSVIRFYVSIDVEDASFEPRHIHNLFQAGVNGIEVLMPHFVAICKDGKSAAEVIAAL